MTTQSEMTVIVRNTINELSKIANYMSKYAKLQIDPISWGAPQFAANDFLQGVKKQMSDLTNLLSVYLRPDLQRIYANYNYDETVKNVRKKLKNIQKEFENLKKYEFSPYYRPLPLDAFDDD